MATFTIPNSIGEIKQNNFKETEGQLIETYNIDMVSNRGKILTSKKLKKVLEPGPDLASSSSIVDMLIWQGNYYIQTEDTLLRSISGPLGAYSEIDAAAASSLFSTMTVFDGQLRFVDTTDIRRYTGSGAAVDNWWTITLAGTALTSGVPHVTATVQSQKETFYVTDGNWVRYYEKGAASTQNVELASGTTACGLASALDGSMWVGTFNETTDNAYVYQIYTNENVDGTPVYRQAYVVDGRAVLAIWVKNNTPYIITEKGAVQAFNGVGFETVATFPFSFGGRYLSGVEAGLVQDSNRARPIHPRGVKLVRDVAFININTLEVDDNYAINNRAHSGVWTFDHLSNQLTHFGSFAKDSTENGAISGQNALPILVPDDSKCEILVAGGTFDGDNVYKADTEYTVGMFTTPEIISNTVTEANNAVYHKATIYDDAKVYTLYRTTKRDTLRFTANWLDSSTFTTTDNIEGLKVGEMIMVSHNFGAGLWTVVKSISKSTNTYTIITKDAIGQAGQTSSMFSDNFKLAGFDIATGVYDENNTYTKEDGDVKAIGINEVSAWVQYKIVLDGRVEYRQFIANGNAKNMV